MIDLTITIPNLDGAIRRLDAMQRAGFAAQRSVIRPLGERYIDALQDVTPVGEGESPGRLRAGYTRQEFYSETQASFRIQNTTPHLRYVLRGRGPVEATRGRMLRFVIRGRVFFRRRVGPAEPNNFPPRARQAMAGHISEAGPAIAQAIIRAYQGGEA